MSVDNDQCKFQHLKAYILNNLKVQFYDRSSIFQLTSALLVNPKEDQNQHNFVPGTPSQVGKRELTLNLTVSGWRGGSDRTKAVQLADFQRAPQQVRRLSWSSPSIASSSCSVHVGAAEASLSHLDRNHAFFAVRLPASLFFARRQSVVFTNFRRHTTVFSFWYF